MPEDVQLMLRMIGADDPPGPGRELDGRPLAALSRAPARRAAAGSGDAAPGRAVAA